MSIKIDPSIYPAQGVILVMALIQAITLALKMAHVVKWSWWIVMAPTWGLVLFTIILLLVLISALGE